MWNFGKKKRTELWMSLFLLFVVGCSAPHQFIVPDRANKTEALEKPYVILVSIDGYRYDYTDLYSPTALNQFRKEGTSAEGILPVYPSKTFTNHYSIATGLYAENHGIVANTFYDPSRKQVFKLSDRSQVQDGTWYGGEPLWVLAEKQGVLAANYFWPGSEAAIQGVRPTYYYDYNERTPLEDRVKQVGKWLDLPAEKRPHFITVYFSDVDTAGHRFGPNSPQVKAAVQKVDAAVSLLRKEVAQRKQLPVNIVIVSDHGMQELDSKKVEFLDDYTSLKSVRLEGAGPQVLIYGEDTAKLDQVYQDLKKKGQHFKVYKRKDLPKNFHYSSNPRAGDLIVVAEAPYSVGVHSPFFRVEGGNHGYDPDTTMSMRGIFYAYGPQIAEGKMLKPFRNIHVYPLIMNILGLKPPVLLDGDFKVLEPIYRKQVPALVPAP